MDLSEGFDTGPALSQPSPDRSSAFSQCQKVCAAVPTLGEAAVLHISSSEELDIESIDTGEAEDSLPHSSAYEEQVEVVSRVVARLNIDWPAEKQDVRRKSKLDDRCLPSQAQPPHRGLLFFPDLHTEVLRLCKKPVSYIEYTVHRHHTTPL